MRTLFNHFLRGLIFVFPLGATIYIIVASIGWANETFNQVFINLFNINFPGLGIVVVFLVITFIGMLVSTTFLKPVYRFFDRTIARMPLVKIIYTSLKELTEAFVGEKRKFNKPVMVDVSDSGLKKLGFITREDLSDFHLKDLVAVYCPHSYNFSGNLFLAPRDKIQPLNIKATDVMKFTVSAGITQINTDS